MPPTPRLTFTPVDGLQEIIEKFQEAEYCRDRSEAINRLLAKAGKLWLASQQGGAPRV
jgi:hypothetical protein